MIKMIAGELDYKSSSDRAVHYTPASGPFELTPDEERRLVDQGVAEYIGRGVKPETAGQPPEIEPAETGAEAEAAADDDEADETEEPFEDVGLEDMTRAELNELATQFGVDAPEKFKSKKALIDAICAAEDDENADDADGIDAAGMIE